VAWSGWRTALVIGKPETVIAWHRQGLRLFWTWKSRRRNGRPPTAADVRKLIQRMAKENPLTAQRLREAFPWNEAPRYVVHDRDAAFSAWTTTAAAIGIEEILTAPRSPWQNAYAERLLGSIRRECLDHIIIINERGLRRVLAAYDEYDSKSRTHLALNKDAPVSRPVDTPADGEIVAIPCLGGLHHHYERRAA
jgi:putative transposase